MHRVLKCLHTSNPIHCSSLHGQLSAGVEERGGVRMGGDDEKKVCMLRCLCVCKCAYEEEGNRTIIGF